FLPLSSRKKQSKGEKPDPNQLKKNKQVNLIQFKVCLTWVVEALLKQGADPNLVLPEGIAAIHLAAGKERESGVRCLKLILQYGGNPNARSVEELTPLHVAASWGCYKCLKLLLRNGGDPNLEDQVRIIMISVLSSPSRLSSRRPSWATSATDHPSGRLSPVLDSCSQDFPLSPGGRPMNLSTHEPVEYLYMDEEEGYALIERHVPCMDNASVLIDTTSSDDTIVYDWRAYQSKLAEQENKENQPLQCKSPMATSKLHLLSDEALIRKLRNLGTNPGPITSRTRKFYLQLLDKLLKDPNTQARKSPELASVLETFQIPDCKDDEMALSRQFDQPDKNRKWREGLLKSSFNYLLLDPRVTQNLPFRCHRLSQADCFRTFISAVFYVGKGKRSRPYSHLYQALTHYRGGKKQVCPKVQHILDIWAGGQGVISVHCFQNVIPVEAYTREACLVDAIGTMLTNQKKGNYYGVVASWAMKRRRCLGIHMLHRAMQIFLAEGERQLRPADIQIGQ
uniref:Ankyrin repeat and LEM domain containing 1 n=1 Tax=Gopherus evgoodei TaxID=1825980 RepID=A0A8C4W317_9SAUR